MREIKFRAYNKNLNQFIYGSSEYTRTRIEYHEYTLSDFWQMIETGAFKYAGQYTGLKDKNGKEIYEGDIVAYSSPMFGNVHKGAVSRYFNGRYKVTYRRGDHPMYIPDERTNEKTTKDLDDWTHSDGGNFAVVIGNLYENPELLEDR